MKLSYTAFLAFASYPSRAASFSLARTAFGPRLQHNIFSETWLKAASDEEDDWYADFDPSQYEQYNENYNDNYSRSRGEGSRGYSSRGNDSRPRRGGHGYSRDTSRDNSNVDADAVNALLLERSNAKRRRDYDTADAIRDDLLKNYAVGIDDRNRSWRTGCSPSGSGRRFGGGGRRERDFGPNGHDYLLSADAGPMSSPLSSEEIHEKLAERLRAKMSRNFDVADSIQMDLIDAGVFVHDGLKEWRGDGVPYGDFGGRGPGKTPGSRSRIYTKSIHSEDAEEERIIEALVNERNKYKLMKDFRKADSIRDGLKTKFDVLIDDKARQWSIGGDFGEDINAKRQLAGVFSTRGYIKSTGSLPLDPEQDKYIQLQIDGRDTAKKERDFDTADAIRDELYDTYNVTIHDKLKLWSVGGTFHELPKDNKIKQPGVYTRRGGGHLSDEDLQKITQMLSERYKALRKRDYDKADEIREYLKGTYAIVVDDRGCQWHVQTKEYVPVGDIALPSDDVEYISDKLRERMVCKDERDYETADQIRDELYERFRVAIDDKFKEWKVKTQVQREMA